ncbi:MAG: HWE histidine kinase domain-containing protein [Acetobacterales bacterium]
MFSDRRIRDALAVGKVGVWRWEVDSARVEWSPNLETIHRMPEGSFDGTFEAFVDDIHPDDRDRVMATIGKVLEAGGAYEVQYRLASSTTDAEYWVEARGTVEADPGGSAVMTGICHDITKRKHAEMELAARLAQQQTIAELGRFALETDDLQRLFNRACGQLAHVLEADCTKVLELTADRDELLLRAGVGWRDGLVGCGTVGTERDSQAGYTLLSEVPVVVSDLARETRFSGPQLLFDHGVVSGMSTVIAGSDGTPYGVLGVHTRRHREFSLNDVHFLQSVANILGGSIQRIKAAEKQQFLFRELSHRVSNLFAQMNAIHRLSAKSSEDIPALCATFESRMAAASQAHAVISGYGWSPTPLRTLLEALLRAYASEVDMEGPAVVIPAEVAFPLALAVNELATNAAKHGCFVDGTGRLSLRWRLDKHDGRHLVIDWNERCSREIAEPDRVSFGTNFLEVVIVRQLQGELKRTFAAHGLHLSVRIPLPVAGAPESATAAAAG